MNTAKILPYTEEAALSSSVPSFDHPLANGGGDGYDSDMDARIAEIEKKVNDINTELKSFKKWYVGTALTLLLICTAIVSTYTMFIIHASNNNFELSMQMLERLGNQTTDIATMKKDIEALKQRR